MTATTFHEAQQLIAQYEQHKKALENLKRLAAMMASGNCRGLRLKANRTDGSQEVVLAEDLGPEFEEGVNDSINRAIEFHTDAMAELSGPEEGPQADPENGPIA